MLERSAVQNSEVPTAPEADVQSVETLIVGAGPAGLAMAGRLTRAGHSCSILEQDHRIASSWQDHYRRLHLHTVKGCSNLPHRPFPSHFPRYVPRQQLVDYYEAYAADFGIKPAFRHRVSRIASAADGGWVVDALRPTGESAKETSSARSQPTAWGRPRRFHAERVVVCTGFNRIPVTPSWPEMEAYQGRVLHSVDYRSGKTFAGQRVLVVGMGNTGAEIALDLLEQGAEPALSVRSAVNVIPRDFLGRSTQQSAMTFSRLPHAIGDRLGLLMQRIAMGDLRPYGLKPAGIAPARQLRELGKTPVMDVGTIAAVKSGAIAVYPGIERFTPQGLRFSDGRESDFDAVVLATGFRSAVGAFVDDAEPLFNRHGVPRACWFDERPGLYFLGFDAYSSGLLWRIREDSGRILEHMFARAHAATP
jgi:cation diffusion facilitator CzcD-associated flavoprotein CzcO